jgi:arylsulfatase A-like enzyme
MVAMRWAAAVVTIWVAAACAVAPLRSLEPRASDARPNILLIVAEDLSPRLGAYGDPVARTPRLDQLAREGVRFTRAFTAAPVCAPSRAALMTGVYAQAFGAQHMRTSRAFDARDPSHSFKYLAVPPPELKAFPERLRRAGYFTANHLKTDYQFGEPFTIWDEMDADETAWFLWRAAPPGQPFFVMLNPVVTHESRIWNRDPLVTDPNAVTVPPWLADTPVTRRDIAKHYDNVATLDSEVGEILDALAADGLLDSTIVIFTTDHGDGLPHAKRRPYDAGLHVPLIVRFPDGRGAGTVRTDLFSFVDLGPMILALAGVEPPRATARDYVFAGADRMDKVPGYWRSVRDERFQYLVNHMPERPLFEHIKFRDLMGSMQELWRLHAEGRLTPLQESQFTAPRPAEELYDLDADPDQTRNLASDPSYRAELERLRAALADFEAHTPDLSREGERAMAERMWPGLVQPKTERPTATHYPEGAIELSCPTPGASIGWRLGGDPPNHWRLYVEPIHAPPRAEIEAKAMRYGYAESEVVEIR